MADRTLDVQVRAKMGAELTTLQNHLKNIGLLLDKANRGMGTQASAAARATASVTGLSRAEALAAQNAGRMMNAVKGGEAALNRMGVVAAQVGPKTQASMRQAQTGVRRFGEEVRRTTSYVGFLRDVLSAFLLYKGFVFLQQQTKLFFGTLVDLEHQLGIIQTQLVGMGDLRPQIGSQIQRIAAETGANMVDLAKAEFEVVSANIAVADSFEILDLTARATVAGGLQDAELAFNAALSQANAFQMSVEQFDDVFDRQFQVIRRGIFTYEQFATVVGTVSEAFASMGQDIETVNASLAAISQVFTGKQLERGATGLRNAVLRISEAPEDFEAMGIALHDAEGDFRNFIDIGRDLNRVLDGMSQSGRAEAIRSLFPDERERRGIGAFLNQLDEAEQFLVEQQFSAGSLENAFETVNDSLLQQSRIFQQDLIPAMEPFVALADTLLGVFNRLDEMLPGLNRTLLTTAAIGAVIGGGHLMMGDRFAMTRAASFPVNAGPMMRGVAAISGSRLPTGLGLAAGGAIAGSMFLSGQRPGRAGVGDFAGAALSGGAAGMFLGGPAGAAIGAAASVAALALGDTFSREAAPTAKTFTDRFTEALKANAGDTAAAFSEALVGSIEVAPGIPLFDALQGGTSGRFQAGVTGGAFNRRMTAGSRAELDQAIAEGRATVTLADLQRFSDLQSTTSLRGRGFSREEIERLQAGEQVQLRSRQQFGRTIAEAEQITLNFSSDDVRKGLVEGFEAFATQGQGLTRFEDNENFIPALQATALRSFEDAFGPGSDISKGAVDLAVKMFQAGKTSEDFAAAIQAAAEGDFRRFLELTGEVNSALEETKVGFERIAFEFQGAFAGAFDHVANVFQRLGAEGEQLAASFRRLANITEGFAFLRQLEETTIGEESFRVTSEAGGMPTFRHFADRAAAEAHAQSLQAQGVVTRTDTFRNTKSLLDALGIDRARIAEEFLQTALGIGGGIGSMDPQAIEDAIIAMFTADPDAVQIEEMLAPLELGANSFADSLMKASELVRADLLDGLGHTADELEMLGEEFGILNRMVRQRSLLMELQGIAEFAGVGTEGIQGAMDLLRQEMVRSGKALFDIMSNPTALAELVAKMEFGDVTLDNSTQNTFTIRISESGLGQSPAAIAAQADALIAEINRKMKQRGSG